MSRKKNWGRQMEFGVARVGKQMGGWARNGTKVRRWMVIGIKGLRAQSDRMLSIGDGWTHVRVLRVCPKKEKKCEWSGSESRQSCQMDGQMWMELADGWWKDRKWHKGQEMGGDRNNGAPGPVRQNAVHR